VKAVSTIVLDAAMSFVHLYQQLFQEKGGVPTCMNHSKSFVKRFGSEKEADVLSQQASSEEEIDQELVRELVNTC